MPEVAEKFAEWAIVEIMGHQTFAGFVSEQVIGGASFVRVDVPEVEGEPKFTKCFGAAAIYCITPCSEEYARAVARRTHSSPCSVYVPELHPREEVRRLSAAPAEASGDYAAGLDFDDE